eukprot:CAMPEP_0114686372 /NCGR_PEP_ID=MMETSP0191-20121206/61438_1 /TAXON_ID=126664 /ORGANISM="Sorites sp." /LENGTH=290 /DNA_ID=CAMNT_0001971841 /DNA_START=341 /DNA_END=1214 /DNA_ORIENTATION=+
MKSKAKYMPKLELDYSNQTHVAIVLSPNKSRNGSITVYNTDVEDNDNETDTIEPSKTLSKHLHIIPVSPKAKTDVNKQSKTNADNNDTNKPSIKDTNPFNNIDTNDENDNNAPDAVDALIEDTSNNISTNDTQNIHTSNLDKILNDMGSGGSDVDEKNISNDVRDVLNDSIPKAIENKIDEYDTDEDKFDVNDLDYLNNYDNNIENNDNDDDGTSIVAKLGIKSIYDSCVKPDPEPEPTFDSLIDTLKINQTLQSNADNSNRKSTLNSQERTEYLIKQAALLDNDIQMLN